MSERERLIKLLLRYFQIGDSYAYNVTRVKTAFEVGTMSLDVFEEFDEETVADIADYLLEHDVIVPPCKVGDTVYQYGKAFTKCTAYDYKPKYIDDSECIGCCAKCDSTSYDTIYEGTVIGVVQYEYGVRVKVRWENKWDNSNYEIGKTVFLTREEAEAALAERRKA